MKSVKELKSSVCCIFLFLSRYLFTCRVLSSERCVIIQLNNSSPEGHANGFSDAWAASLYDSLQGLSLHGMVVLGPFKGKFTDYILPISNDFLKFHPIPISLPLDI